MEKIKKPKLIVAYIVENDDDCFELSYQSIKEVADKIIIIDGNHLDKSTNKNKFRYHSRDSKVFKFNFPYKHNLKGANGFQRNLYLDLLKQQHEGDWCLVLDADEVVDKPKQIKQVIKEAELREIECVDIHMRHCVYNLGHEDATVEKHYVPTRLFKITEKLNYPEAEHVTLQGIKNIGKIDHFCVWHLGYAREIFRLRSKLINHQEKSNIHNEEFLDWWYHAHLFGQFPTKPVKPEEIPEVIKTGLKVKDDYLYFKDRKSIESKHFLDAYFWKQYFNPKTAIDIGCGCGARVFAMSTYGIDAYGLEKSSHAKKISSFPIRDKIRIADITDFEVSKAYDLVIAYDLLEHISEKELDNVLKTLNQMGDNFVFSIPFEGDPNLYNDPTHKIFKSREWWEGKLKEHKFKLEIVPQHFPFAKQLIIAKK